MFALHQFHAAAILAANRFRLPNKLKAIQRRSRGQTDFAKCEAPEVSKPDQTIRCKRSAALFHPLKRETKIELRAIVIHYPVVASRDSAASGQLHHPKLAHSQPEFWLR
jgi:hypothetical protein